MSDFVFSNRLSSAGDLAQVLAELTHIGGAQVQCFEGPWGSLAVSPNRHAGYQPFEDEIGIAIVVGAPLTRLASVTGMGVSAANRCTATIAKRLFRDGEGSWHSDLLTPFCFLHINKKSHAFSVVTDSMSFIPAYVARHPESSNAPFTLSTHVDAAALSCADDKTLRVDRIAACDLILNKRVTYPYTLYSNVREISPATVHEFDAFGRHEKKIYWRPTEQACKYPSIADAAADIREGLEEVMRRAIDHYGELGILLSGGEDSRLLACMVPKDVPLHCFTVAPCENRESKIAQRVATALKRQCTFIRLPPEKYFENLGERSLFTGTNTLGRLAHFINIFEDTAIPDQRVVVGGFKADTFLKAHYFRARSVVPGLGYQYVNDSPTKTKPMGPLLFTAETEGEIVHRQQRHRETIQEFRTNSVDEWARFWPMSQDHDVAHYWSNRRLFAAEEVFMSPTVLNAAACMPTEWVLNRRVFYLIAKPYLRRLWWIPHSDGHFPAFPWYANLFLRPWMRFRHRFELSGANRSQGTWPSLEAHVRKPEMREYLEGLLPLADALSNDVRPAANAVFSAGFSLEQRYGYIQMLAVIDTIIKRGFTVRTASPVPAAVE